VSFSTRPLKRAIPQPLAPFAQAVYHALYRSYLPVAFWFADRLAASRSDVPIPPANLRFRVTEQISAANFLRIGEGCSLHIAQEMDQLGVDISGARRVLDFGCGCGRTIRWFLKPGVSTEFHGADVDRDAIAWCQINLPAGHFIVNSADPPLPYPAGHFDIVYCFSVFTHLDEVMQDAWLAELHRILTPGGILLLTVHGDTASQALPAEDRELLRARGFVHRRSPKLRGLMPDWYQTTWHSEEYIVKRLSARFTDIRYHVIADGMQDIVVARKTVPPSNL